MADWGGSRCGAAPFLAEHLAGPTGRDEKLSKKIRRDAWPLIGMCNASATIGV
jgi:hypothetical protein